MRRTHYLVIILLLIAQTSFGQIYQNMAQPGYKFSRARFDSVLTIPTGLGGLRNITGGQDTGQIRFNLSDSSVYVWNGRGWIKAGGGTDTASLSNRINLKLNISDTASMLSNYAKTSAVNLKLNISDTATMLAPYSRVGVTSYGKNATADSTILLLSNGTRYAAKDSVGSGWALTGNASAVTDFLGTTNNRTMRFRTNNTERMVIDSLGNVGIGTATPNSILNIIKNQNASTSIIIENTNSGILANSNITIKTDESSEAQFGKNSSTYTPYKSINAYDTYIYSNSNIGGDIVLQTDGLSAGKIKFASGSVSTPNMTLTAAGSLLIGTTTENTSALLNVTSTTKGVLFPRMTSIQRDGISTPATGLQVYNTTTNTYDYFNGSIWRGMEGANWGLTGNASAVTDFLGTTNNRTLRFRTNNTERMVIDSIGNVGIGTGAPSDALHIVKQIGSQAIIKLQTLDNTTTSGYSGLNTFDNSGNLAFSFAYGNPSSALPNSAIIGPRTATGALSFVTTAAANTQMRMFANGNFTFQTTGTFTDIPSAKVAVNSTTQGVLFPRMTAAQRNAIATPAAGLQVIVTGETGGEFLSIYNSSTSTWQRNVLSTNSDITSVFVGNGSGSGASGATNSNFFGTNAGLNASSAPASNFFGTNAGSGATSASGSNFFGNNAGLSASAASSSNFFGDGSGVSATNALASNFFGADAGSGATNANASNFFGSTAGFGATGANNSNFFGFRAGRNATGASHSNFIGFNVGNSTTHTITGANNIIIGTNITTPTAATANSANIGGVLYLTGTYGTTTGNPRALAQTAGKVGINTTTPVASAVLEITSTTAGVLFPRMTTAQKTAIASPVAGLVVYDTTLNKLCVYTTTWETITSL